MPYKRKEKRTGLKTGHYKGEDAGPFKAQGKLALQNGGIESHQARISFGDS